MQSALPRRAIDLEKAGLPVLWRWSRPRGSIVFQLGAVMSSAVLISTVRKCLTISVPQQVLLYLAHRVAGKFADDAQFPRMFVARQRRSRSGCNRFQIRRAARRRHDQAKNSFAEIGIRHADHRALEHARLRIEQ